MGKRLDVVSMRLPHRDAPAELLGWTCPHGVISIAVTIDPEDRSEPWRIELKNGLSAVVEKADPEAGHEARLALEETAARVLDRFPAEYRHGEGRAQLGFVEVSREDDGQEEWFQAQLPLSRTEVVHNSRPYLYPLLRLLDEGAPRGVLVASSEEARLLHWELGSIEQLEEFELESFALDWRERRSPRPADPSSGQGVTSSGRDQHRQRLDANRQHFLREVGAAFAGRARERGWEETLVLARPELAEELREGAGPGLALRVADGHDLISAPAGAIQERIRELRDGLNRERELELIEEISERALSGGRGALGPADVAAALWEGRAQHLVLDADRDYSAVEVQPPPGVEWDLEISLPERLIEQALATSAQVTPAEGIAAERLADAEGLGALLRY